MEERESPQSKDMPLLVLFCGRSFSGKSSLSQGVAASLSAELISYDVLNEDRGLRGGEGIPLEEWGRTNDIAHDLARTALESRSDVVVDDTSSPRFLRDQWRELASDMHARFVLVYVDTDVATLRARLQANRKTSARHDVSDDVFEQHLADFELPSSDEPHLRVTPGKSLDEIIASIRNAAGIASSAKRAIIKDDE